MSKKDISLIAYYLLLITFLAGCATTGLRGTDTVILNGTRYVSVQSLAGDYNLGYLWDPIAKKASLYKENLEVKILLDSSIVLINNNVRTMNKQAIFHQGSLAVPQSFAHKILRPLLKEKEGYSQRGSAAFSVFDSAIKKVIIDAGHGGTDPGAIGQTGLKEKDVVLDIAKRLKQELEYLGIEVVMTRQSDKFLSLAQRALVANSNSKPADFFISIHANASRARSVSGVEVFSLSENIDDNHRSLTTAEKYALDIQEGTSGRYTTAIIWDLLFTDYRRQSQQLADFVCRALSRKLSQQNRGIKQARFYVLKSNIPAVLVEVGFISNARDEQKLRDALYQDKIAQGIADGLMQYNDKFTQRRTARY